MARDLSPIERRIQESMASGPVQIDYRNSPSLRPGGGWLSVPPLPSLQPVANTLPPTANDDKPKPKQLRSKRWLLAALMLLAAAGLAGSCQSTHRQPPVSEQGVVRCLGAPSIKGTDSGKHVRWHAKAIDLVIDPSVAALGSGAAQAVRDAVDTWMEKADVPDVTVDIARHRGKAEQDGVNRVVAAPITIPGHENDLALTITYVDQSTGALLEADIVLNTAHRWGLVRPPSVERVLDPSSHGHAARQAHFRDHLVCSHRFDVQNVVTHELGHFFGLGEDTEDTEATMYYKSNRCETKKRSLSEEDVRVVDELYAEPVEQDEEMGMSCSVQRRGQGESGWGWLWLAGALAIWRRRRFNRQ